MPFVRDPRTAILARCAAILVLAAACSDASGPVSRPESATVQWNARARAMVEYYNDSPPMASRVYALLGVAQHNAARSAARFAGFDGTAREAAERVAIASASARLLSALYPAQAEAHAAELAAQRGALGEGAPIDVVTRSEEAGVAAARAVLSRAADDGSDAGWTGQLPSGAGVWSGGAPLLPAWGSVRPWYLERGDQFRAPEPPARESEAFAAALLEVREMSDHRTEDDLALANEWAGGARSVTPAGQWNEVAAELLARYGSPDYRAAQVMAQVNAAMMDATIACWDSKFAYWVQRPWEADPAITTPIGRPPHPSYPSGHSCISAAAVTVLAAHFPSERRRLEQMSDDAGWSRVCAGIHYRFDVDAGKAIGRSVGALARDSHLPTTEQILAAYPPSRSSVSLALAGR